MKEKVFKVLYIIFIICVILYGRIYIANIATPRQLMAVVMLLASLFSGGWWLDKYFRIYLGFIAFYFLSATFDDNVMGFMHTLLGYFAISYSIYYSTILFLNKFKGNIHVIIFVLLGIGCLNSLVTICQVFMPSLANSMISLMRVGSIETWEYLEMYHSADDMFTHSMTGLFESAVFNGYWSMTFCILATFEFIRESRFIRKVVYLAITVFMLGGLIACMQRTSLVVALVFVAYLLVTHHKKLGKIFALIAGIVVIYYLSKIDFSSLGRLSSLFELGVREDISKNSRIFVSENWLLGGIKTYSDRYAWYPHNLIYNAIIYSGIFGAFFIFYLLYTHLKVAIPYSFKPSRYPLLCALSLCYISYTLNSLFHNNSLVSGDPQIWFLWGLLIAVHLSGEQPSLKKNKLQYE